MTSRRSRTRVHTATRCCPTSSRSRSSTPRCRARSPARAAVVRRRGFASDNAATVHPRVLEAIAARQRRSRLRVRARRYTQAVERARGGGLRRPEASVFFVFNGTGANVLCLRAALPAVGGRDLCPRPRTCTPTRSARPRRSRASSCWSAETLDGKLTPEGVRRLVERPDDEHAVKPGVLSIYAVHRARDPVRAR